MPEQVGDVKASLQSGIQQRSVAGNPILFFGEPVQADGTVRLVGTGLVTFQLALQTGTGLTCRLSPVPDLSTLPKGPKLQAAKGKIKVGPDPAAADDDVTLTAIVEIGATAPVLDGTQDVLLRLQGATGEAMSVLAPGGKFSVKGKKLTLTDTDGTVIQGMRDQPHSANPDEQPAPLPPTKGGSVVIKGSKKRVTLIFKLNGVDAAQLSGRVRRRWPSVPSRPRVRRPSCRARRRPRSTDRRGGRRPAASRDRSGNRSGRAAPRTPAGARSGRAAGARPARRGAAARSRADPRRRA